MIPLHALTDEQPALSRRTARRVELGEQRLSSLAWEFLRSELTGLTYADWPIDRRLEADLSHLGMTPVVNDGDAFDALLQRVLATIGPALRAGILTTTTWLASRRNPVSRIGADACVSSMM
jgi:hypothetical protein